MKKIIKLFIFLMFTMILLCGCDRTVAENNGGYDRFYKVYYNTAVIYIDKETRVMYLAIAQNSGTGITVMVDENGNPLLWEGEF